MRGQGLGESPGAEPDRAGLTATAILGVLAGTSAQIAFGFAGALPDVDPNAQLQSFIANRLLFYGYGWAFALFAIANIGFLVALATLLQKKAPAVASVARGLGIVGPFLMASQSVFFVGALASVQEASGSAPSAADAIYQGAVIAHISDFLGVFGWMALGFGMILFGWLIFRSGVLPDWFRWLAFIGGAAGLAPFVVGAAFPSVTDTPGFPWFSNPGFPVADFVTGWTLTVLGFATAVALFYRIWPRRLMPLGIAMVLIGVAVFPPYQSITLLWPFFIGSGVALIWLSRRGRPKPADTGKPPIPA